MACNPLIPRLPVIAALKVWPASKGKGRGRAMGRGMGGVGRWGSEGKSGDDARVSRAAVSVSFCHSILHLSLVITAL